MTTKNKHFNFIETARCEAAKSSMAHRYGTVLVHRGKIISTGYNTFANNSTYFHSVHAEVNCIKKYQKVPKHCTMYLCRIDKDANLVGSMPCANCSAVLAKNKIKCIHTS